MEIWFLIATGIIVGFTIPLISGIRKIREIEQMGEMALGEINKERHMEKEKSKKKIMTLFNKQENIKNKDVRELLKVSDPTATRYMDELEDENKIRQIGKVGRAVIYEKI